MNEYPIHFPVSNLTPAHLRMKAPDVSLGNDIALIELEEEVTLSDR